MTARIPLLDLETQHRPIREELIRALTRVGKHFARARELFVLERASVTGNLGGVARGERNAVRKQLKGYLGL